MILSSKSLSSLLAVLWLAGAAAAGRADDVFTPLHVARLRSVVGVSIAPDGEKTAYTLAVPADVEKGKNGSSTMELWVVARGSAPRRYVSQASVSSVEWTPDGEEISFLSRRGDAKESSLWVIPYTGGEAREVLTFKSGVSAYSWSPDGKQVAFLSTPALEESVKKAREKGFNAEIYEEDWRPAELWIAGLGDDAEAPRKLSLDGVASGVRWSPAGDRLLIELAPTALVDDHYMHRRLHVVAVADGKVLGSIPNPGKLGDAAWSPDGKLVAYITGEDENDPKEGRLWVSPAEGATKRDLLPGFEGHVAAFAWSGADRIAYVGDVGCRTMLGEVSLAGENRVVVPPGETILSSLSVSKTGAAAALVAETARHPGEVFRWSRGDATITRESDSNPWLAKMRFAEQEIVSHEARDGLRLEGILVRPLDAEKGKRYPLILTVHGGPEAHISNGWVTRYSYPGQVAAARGFAVFYPNYRGSTGRGVAFSKSSQADAAGKEFDDLVDAVDHLVEIGLVDKDKVGITGGSYGGYASAWGATYYSHRFAASVMFVGISDNISKVGTTDIPLEMYKVHHRKWLWDDWKYFLERSPIYHVQKARTPILILHGKEDPRVHPSQSMELYRHLKNLGQTPVRLVFYPGEGHGNRNAAARYDYNLRLLRWFEHYLQGEGGAAPPAEIDHGLEKPEEKAPKPNSPTVRRV